MEQDSQVFDYDSVYDDLKAQELYQKRIRDGDDGSSKKKARYMADLIKSANDRKLYLEKAAERKLLKEREEEGGVYGDKEEFVTEAYLEKQKELKRLEEEQKIKDELEADPHRNRDMTGFYRDLLEKKERKPPLVLGDTSMMVSGTYSNNEKDQTHNKPLPSGVILNDNLEIVDKRQLLSGGLNVTSKALKKKEEEVREKEEEVKKRKEQARVDREKRETERKRQDQLRMQRERNRDFVLSQKEVAEQEKKLKKEKEEQESRELLLKSTVTQDVVLDARARYLARKAAQAQQETTK